MIGRLGYGAVLLALLFAGTGALLALAAARTRRRALALVAGDMALLMSGLVAAAFLLMEYALVTHDFSVSYVAQVGSRATPLFYTIISLWSALEGSILLWALLLAGYTVALVRWSRRRPEDDRLGLYALAVILGVNVFFLLVIAIPANPFRVLTPAPEDGPGPNALLQNHPFMAVHPPLLYTGYVGMAVPFALAMGALLHGRLDRDWAKATRAWSMVPWTFLSVGILAGMWWSYEVLGWGGYWAWDPVENASFLPWLTATAFLHSVMVQERRGMLNLWTLSLILATFALTVLGTFLTRSGVLASVHAFTESQIGVFFLSFLAVVCVAAVVLVTWRAGRFRTVGRLDSLLCRETLILGNNFLFVLFTFVVLFGTIFPLLAEALRGTKVTVGEPFFNQMTMPLTLALIVMVGVGPALPWGKGAPGEVLRKFRVPGAAALLVGLVLLAAGVRAPVAWLAFVAIVFSAGLLVGEVVTPTRQRRRARGEAWGHALARVLLSSRRRYGGYIVHLGVLLVALGIAASSGYRRQDEWTLHIGERATFGEYTIRLDSLWAVSEPHRDAVVAGVTVHEGRRRLGPMFPRLNFYRNSVEPIGSPAVRESLGEDLYLVLLAFAQEGSHATLQAIVSPLVTWIWAGGVVILLGALFALWPAGRSRRPEEVATAPASARRRDEPVAAGDRARAP